MALEGELDAAVSETAVTFEFSVINTGPGPIELEFADACRAEFVVEQGEAAVWRFTDGRVFAQVLGSERLAPDETAIYDGRWSDPPAGSYTAVAELQARNATCKARTEFSV